MCQPKTQTIPTAQGNHNVKTKNLGNITADKLDGDRLLQVQDSNHKAVLLRPFDVLLKWKRSPGKPGLHRKTSDFRVLLFRVVLDVVDLEALKVLVCSKNEGVSKA